MNLFKSWLVLVISLALTAVFSGCGHDDDDTYVDYVDIDVNMVPTNTTTVRQVTEVHHDTHETTVVVRPVVIVTNPPVITTTRVLVRNQSSYVVHYVLSGKLRAISPGQEIPWGYTGSFSFNYEIGDEYFSRLEWYTDGESYIITFTDNQANPGIVDGRVGHG